MYFIQDHRGTVVKIADFIGHPLSEEIIDNVVKHSSLKAMRETHFTTKAPKPGVGDEPPSTDAQHKRIGAYGLLRKGKLLVLRFKGSQLCAIWSAIVYCYFNLKT